MKDSFALLTNGKYITANKTLTCPSTQDIEFTGTNFRNAYDPITDYADPSRRPYHLSYIYISEAYTAVGGYRLSEAVCTSASMLTMDYITNHKEYGNVLYGDGHVSGFAGTNWWKADRAHGIFEASTILNQPPLNLTYP